MEIYMVVDYWSRYPWNTSDHIVGVVIDIEKGLCQWGNTLRAFSHDYGSAKTHLENILCLYPIVRILYISPSYMDGLVQGCSNSIVNALELLQSCTKPSISWLWTSTAFQITYGRQWMCVVSHPPGSSVYTIPERFRHMRVTLKRKCLHFDEIFITGCTGSCQNDNFQCSQWLKFRQNDDIFVSVYFCTLL